MDLKPFKLDIDELINEFAEVESTTLADMKRVWLSKKFSFIFEASPSTNLAFFMQSLYAHSIGYMVSTTSLSHRLGGLYCLYCLYETQPFKPPFKIYLSLGELKGLKNLVVDAKGKGMKVVSALIYRMPAFKLHTKSYLQILGLKHFIHMDLGKELDVDELKKMSKDYAEAKELAIKEASDVVDVQNIRHIAENERLIGDVVEKTAGDWNVQKELFYQQTGMRQHPAIEPPQQEDNENSEQQEDNENSEQEEDIDNFGMTIPESFLYMEWEQKEVWVRSVLRSLDDRNIKQVLS
ncbi:hypothetical protein F0562_029958 [Nyssa sinensis]|uniref:Small nuclear RNA activating complex (SNAPc), subunit SNAP43 protein n=1 Tax=Nyssa sinensis TaxID=561372 RepID=A0A5J5AUX9_9ASTE|nr:hypothetical protein F0562_029958 [Nyssa sinensis]